MEFCWSCQWCRYCRKNDGRIIFSDWGEICFQSRGDYSFNILTSYSPTLSVPLFCQHFFNDNYSICITMFLYSPSLSLSCPPLSLSLICSKLKDYISRFTLFIQFIIDKKSWLYIHAGLSNSSRLPQFLWCSRSWGAAPPPRRGRGLIQTPSCSTDGPNCKRCSGA